MAYSPIYNELSLELNQLTEISYEFGKSVLLSSFLWPSHATQCNAITETPLPFRPSSGHLYFYMPRYPPPAVGRFKSPAQDTAPDNSNCLSSTAPKPARSPRSARAASPPRKHPPPAQRPPPIPPCSPRTPTLAWAPPSPPVLPPPRWTWFCRALLP